MLAPDAKGEAADGPQEPGHPYRWVMLAGVWLAYYCFGLTIVTIAPLVDPIRAELGLSNTQMGTIMGAWQLVYIVSAIPLGALLERIGPRRALLLALTVIASSAALRGVAEGYLSLFLAVAVFGFGGPLVSVGAPKLISLWFDTNERGLAMGIYITGPQVGGMTALSLSNSVMMPLMGGDWRAVMFGYAAFVVLVAAVWLALTAHPASREMERRLAAEPRESQFKAFGNLIAIPAVRVTLVMAVGIFFFNHGLNNWLPKILGSHGMSPSEAGFWASVPTLIAIASSITIPRLATPQRRMKILLGLFLSAAVATLLLHTAEGPVLAVGLVFQGVARGAMMTLAVLTLLDVPEVGAKRAGLAGGLFFSAAEIGGVFGPVAIGAISDTAGGFGASLVLMTAICLALVGLLGLLRRVSN